MARKLENIYFAVVFAIFNAFLIMSVDGFVAKFWLAGWVTCVAVGAIYIYRIENPSTKAKD